MSDIQTLTAAVEEVGQKSAEKIKQLESRVGRLDAGFTELAQKSTGMPGVVGVVHSGPVSGGLANMLQKDEGLQAMREGRSKSAILKLDGGVDMLIKTLVGDVASSVNDLYPVRPDRAPSIYNDSRMMLPLIGMMPRIQVASGSFEYVSLDSGYTNDGGYQTTQGAIKPETALPMELLSANIATITTTLPVSEQVLADAPVLQQFIVSKLTYQVLLKLEFEIIQGVGGTGQIDGLINMGVPYVQSSTVDAADAIGGAAANMQAIGWMPSAVLLHPTTWHRIRSTRIDSGTGEYLVGTWAESAPPNIWGVPVIATPNMPTDKAVVVDMNQVALLNRQNVVFEFGYIDDQFIRNVRTARAELRAGLMVAAPSAVQVLDI